MNHPTTLQAKDDILVTVIATGLSAFFSLKQCATPFLIRNERPLR
jgi:hypothetical protein